MKDITLNPGAAAMPDHESAPAAGMHSGRKAVIAASAGNALEWYDFTVYALFAVYIGQNFFQNSDPAVQLMASFLAFGLGFVVRPLGALVLGSYGDRAGRKAALTLTIMLMALGTLLIAAAPPYAAIGVGAPLLIVCGRVLQGFWPAAKWAAPPPSWSNMRPKASAANTPRGCRPAWASPTCWARWSRPWSPRC